MILCVFTHTETQPENTHQALQEGGGLAGLASIAKGEGVSDSSHPCTHNPSSKQASERASTMDKLGSLSLDKLSLDKVKNMVGEV